MKQVPLRSWLRAFGLVGVVVLVACQSGQHASMAPPGSPPSPEARATTSAQAPTRLLIRRAFLDLVVADVTRAMSRAQSLALGAGGYVEREQRSERNASLTLRVPEARLDVVLDSLSTLGDVEARTVSAEDVTDQVLDLDARVKTLITMRDRFRLLLERASTVSEIIEVERELARIQSDIESIEARLTRMRESAALAELRLSVSQKKVLGPLGLLANGIGWVVGKLFVIR